MIISFSDMLRVKREAKQLRTIHPDIPHNKLLSQAATALFGVRGFHELIKLREQTINEHLIATESLAKCNFCGLEFCPDIADDRKTHQTRHNAFEEATGVLNYIPKQYADREASKKSGYILMQDSDLGPEQQLQGALMIIRAWFDRSLDSAIDGQYWKQHPGFEQYITYIVGDLDSFPLPIVDALIQRYGQKDGLIPKGKSYWYPPKH